MSNIGDIPPKDQKSWINFGISLARLISKIKQRKAKKGVISQPVAEPAIRPGED
jgi:hypothetical protein